MPNLTEAADWIEGLYRLETTDPVLGGEEGIDNLQAKQLGARTRYLKAMIEGLGADKQPIDALLTALAALVTSADKGLYFSGVDTPALTTLTAFARTLLDDADAATARATLGAASPADVAAAIAALVNSSPAALDTLNELAAALGNDANYAATVTTALAGKQPIDATLTALASIATAADKLIYATGADAFATTPLTAFMRTLLDDADAAAALVTLGAAAASSVRIRLAGNITFYVATTGNDANNGLTVGTPFLTIQKAVDTINQSYDLSGYVATIQLADGTYTSGAYIQSLPAGVGRTANAPIIIKGNAATPANTVISTTNTHCVTMFGGIVQVEHVKLKTTSYGNCLYSLWNAILVVGAGVIFDTAATSHFHAEHGGLINIGYSYTIVGGAQAHLYALNGGNIRYGGGITVTLTGTPAFSSKFAASAITSMVVAEGITFSGAATGTRYEVTINGVITVAGGGANYFPGNAAGTAATGGQYV